MQPIHQNAPEMLTKVRDLIDALNGSGIRYCHWKSNSLLGDALLGQTDIDLLIHRNDAANFRAILSRLSYQPAVVDGVESFPSVEHYFGLDEESGILVHVHAYYRVITGESLTKNYRFPIEEMLLQNTREANSVRVPKKSAELVVFTLRMMLKHTSLFELVLLARYWEQAQAEMKWLLDADPIDQALEFVNCWLPAVDVNLFAACIAALEGPAPTFRRIMLGRQLRSQLRSYARHGLVHTWLGGAQKFLKMLYGRISGSRLGMVPQAGGAVIAFVGPEATGKSTLLAEINKWFGEHFNVEQIHSGKPKSTLLTIVPNLLVPAMRRFFPSYRSTRVEKKHTSRTESESSKKGYPLVYTLRSALLAHDRRSLLTRAFAQAANGTIVLCDRYPSSRSGAPDGPQLSDLATSHTHDSIRSALAKIEARLYREIPRPDLVVYLCAPLEVTLSRNRDRDKTEPEDYVRQRHARSANLTFDRTTVHRINTDQPFELTILEVKKAIWNSLY